VLSRTSALRLASAAGPRWARVVMRADRLARASKKSGTELKMIDDSMFFEPIGAGIKRHERAPLGEIDRRLDQWPGAKTEYRLVSSGEIVPLGHLKFTPII
jgi:hypothetical protein